MHTRQICCPLAMVICMYARHKGWPYEVLITSCYQGGFRLFFGRFPESVVSIGMYHSGMQLPADRRCDGFGRCVESSDLYMCNILLRLCQPPIGFGSALQGVVLTWFESFGRGMIGISVSKGSEIDADGRVGDYFLRWYCFPCFAGKMDPGRSEGFRSGFGNIVAPFGGCCLSNVLL